MNGKEAKGRFIPIALFLTVCLAFSAIAADVVIDWPTKIPADTVVIDSFSGRASKDKIVLEWTIKGNLDLFDGIKVWETETGFSTTLDKGVRSKEIAEINGEPLVDGREYSFQIELYREDVAEAVDSSDVIKVTFSILGKPVIKKISVDSSAYLPPFADVAIYLATDKTLTAEFDSVEDTESRYLEILALTDSERDELIEDKFDRKADILRLFIFPIPYNSGSPADIATVEDQRAPLSGATGTGTLIWEKVKDKWGGFKLSNYLGYIKGLPNASDYKFYMHVGNFIRKLTPEGTFDYYALTWSEPFEILLSAGSRPGVTPPPPPPVRGLRFSKIYYGDNFRTSSSLLAYTNTDNPYAFENPTPFRLKIEDVTKGKSVYVIIDHNCEELKGALEKKMKEDDDYDEDKDFWYYFGENVGGELKSFGKAVYKAAKGFIKGVGETVTGIGAGLGIEVGEEEGDKVVTGSSEDLFGARAEVDGEEIELLPGVKKELKSTDWFGINGSEIEKTKYLWQVDKWNEKAVGSNDSELKEGKEVTFYVCQYPAANVIKEAKIKIRFGKPPTPPKLECKSILECLAAIDKDVVKGIYD